MIYLMMVFTVLKFIFKGLPIFITIAYIEQS